MSHETKTNDLKLQRLQALLLKSVMLTTNVAEQFCAKSSGTSSVADIAKIAIKFCADSAMVLGQLNSYLLDSRREFILPELNSDFRKIVIEKGEHPELLFGDNLSQKNKDISETNKLGQAVVKRNFVPIKTGPQKSQPFLYRPQGRPRGRYHKSQTDNEVSKIKDSFIESNKTFQAGQIKNFVDEWENITSDRWIIDTVLGAKIEFEDISKNLLS